MAKTITNEEKTNTEAPPQSEEDKTPKKKTPISPEKTLEKVPSPSQQTTTEHTLEKKPKAPTPKKSSERTTKKSTFGKPSWVKMTQTQLEKLIIELVREGKTPAQIGLILRDQHGVPRSKLLGKKITHILKEKNVTYPTEKDLVDHKITTLKSHIGKNKHDYTATLSLTKLLWVQYKLNKKQ